MRRLSAGQGKSTPDALNEPDFYLIAKQYPLEKSPAGAGVLEMDEEQVQKQKKEEAPFYGRQDTEYLDGESSKKNGDDEENVPNVAREAFGMENPSHSFASFADESADGGVGGGGGSKEDKVQAESESSVQEVTMTYDCDLVSPMMPNNQGGSSRGHSSLHPSASDYHEVALILNQPHYDTNVNQYAAARDSHQAAAVDVAAAAAGYYNYNSPPRPQYSQKQHDTHNNNNKMFIDYHHHYDCWYRNPYYSNHSANANGLAQGYAQPPNHRGVHTHMASQLNYSAQSFHDRNPPSYVPDFSPLPLRHEQEDEEESVDAERPSTLHLNHTATATADETADSLLQRAMADMQMWKETALAALKEVDELKKKISKNEGGNEDE